MRVPTIPIAPTALTAPITPIEKELIMVTLQLTFNNEAEYALFDTLFEKFKIKKSGECRKAFEYLF